nr:type II toxin-antitoxin system HicA family toxin [Nevskia sp.]
MLSGKQACEILRRHGFIEVRRKGSHIVMQRRLTQTTITVPVPDHPELAVGTLQSVIRQSGIARVEFESGH